MDGLLRILGVLKTQDRRYRMSVVILLVIVLFFLVLLAVSDTVTRATESSDVGIPLIAFSFVGLFISCALLMAWILSLDKLLVAKLSTFSPEQIRTFIDYMLDEGIEYEMAEAKNIRRRCGIIRSKPSRQETDKIDFV